MAIKLLRDKFGDDEDTITLVFSNLRKAGLIEVKIDPNDARKNLYRIIVPV